MERETPTHTSPWLSFSFAIKFSPSLFLFSFSSLLFFLHNARNASCVSPVLRSYWNSFFPLLFYSFWWKWIVMLYSTPAVTSRELLLVVDCGQWWPMSQSRRRRRRLCLFDCVEFSDSLLIKSLLMSLNNGTGRELRPCNTWLDCVENSSSFALLFRESKILFDVIAVSWSHGWSPDSAGGKLKSDGLCAVLCCVGSVPACLGANVRRSIWFSSRPTGGDTLQLTMYASLRCATRNNLALNDATVRTINPITHTHAGTHHWAPFIKPSWLPPVYKYTREFGQVAGPLLWERQGRPFWFISPCFPVHTDTHTQ